MGLAKEQLDSIQQALGDIEAAKQLINRAAERLKAIPQFEHEWEYIATLDDEIGARGQALQRRCTYLTEQ